MSDDLVMRLRENAKIKASGDIVTRLQSPTVFDSYDYLLEVTTEAAAEITRLRAELDTARLVPPLNPDRWRGAINDALTNWMDSILDDEVPKDALCRLTRYEVTAALDPAVSQSAADLVATARRDALAEIKQDTDELIEQGRQDGMEQAAQIADSRGADWAKSAIGKYINSKWDFQSRAEAGEEIAAAIRAAAKEGKP